MENETRSKLLEFQQKDFEANEKWRDQQVEMQTEERKANER
jgi:hypothetical protein